MVMQQILAGKRKILKSLQEHGNNKHRILNVYNSQYKENETLSLTFAH